MVGTDWLGLGNVRAAGKKCDGVFEVLRSGITSGQFCAHSPENAGNGYLFSFISILLFVCNIRIPLFPFLYVTDGNLDHFITRRTIPFTHDPSPPFPSRVSERTSAHRSRRRCGLAKQGYCRTLSTRSQSSGSLAETLEHRPSANRESTES